MKKVKVLMASILMGIMVSSIPVFANENTAANQNLINIENTKLSSKSVGLLAYNFSGSTKSGKFDITCPRLVTNGKILLNIESYSESSNVTIIMYNKATPNNIMLTRTLTKGNSIIINHILLPTTYVVEFYSNDNKITAVSCGLYDN